MEQHEGPPVRITLLGTGTSTGVPVIGCSCRVCTSSDPKDHRTRCSCFVEVNDVQILIDAGPDFRTQALRTGLTNIDALLITHHHFDHVAGIDDLRPFFFKNKTPIPCYTHADSAASLRKMYGYIFEDGSYPGIARLEMHDVSESFNVVSRFHEDRTVTITPIEVFHGSMPTFGYRIGRFAYLTDTNNIPTASLELLHDLDVLVLDALRHEPHRSHYTIAEAVQVAQRIGARHTYFIHMTHSVLYAEENPKLPDGMTLAYDGLTIEAR